MELKSNIFNKTALIYAAKNGHLEVVEAIDYARKNDYQEIVDLLSNGKKRSKKKKKSESVNHKATTKSHEDDEELLNKLKNIENENNLLKKLQKEQEIKIKKLEKENSKLKKENESLHSNPEESTGDKIKLAESIWSLQNEIKNIDNCFIDNDDEKYHKYIEKVGEGATSITYKVSDTRTETVMCKKILKIDPDNPPTMKDIKKIIKEFEILVQINHPCICKASFINTQEEQKDANIDDSSNDTIAIFLEFLEIDLKKELKKGLNNTLKTRIVDEISHALNYLHKKGMIHRDLKIENIMLNSVYQAKLVDFGLVRIHECLPDYSYTEDSMTKGVGTLAYMSPEMLNEEEYDYKTDVYSFGVFLYALFTGKVPKQSMKYKMKGKQIEFPDTSSSISNFCIKLIKKCMEKDPDDRPTFEEILEELRKNEYALASSIDKLVIHQRDMELSFFEAK